MPDLKRVWFPTRLSKVPLYNIKKKLFIQSIVGSQIEEEINLAVLTYREYFTISLCYQTNMYYTIQLMEILKLLPGMTVFISVFFLQLVIGVPLLILLVFMSSYSGKGFLKFWDCIPIFRGIGYAILLARFLYCLHLILFSAVATECALDILMHPDITKSIQSCAFADKSTCLPMFPKVNNTLHCKQFSESGQFDLLTAFRSTNLTAKKVFFSTQHHFRYHILQYDPLHDNEISVNYSLVLTAFFTWLATFFICILGARRIKTTLQKIQFFCDFAMLFIIVIAMFSNFEITNDYSMVTSTSTMNFNNWVYIYLHATDIFIISDVIWAGKMKPKSLSVNIAGCVLGSLKTSVFLLVIFLSRRCSQLVFDHYKYTDKECLLVTGYDIVFAFLPDVLYRTEFGVYLNLFWYFSLSYTAFHVVIYTLISIVNALLEYFGRLRNCRIILYAILCFIAFCFNFFFCTNFAMFIFYHFHYFTEAFLIIISTLSVVIGLIFIYTIQKVVEDFKFCNYYPSPYFISALKFAAGSALCIFLYMLLYFKSYTIQNLTPRLAYLALLKNIAFILPMILILMYQCYTSSKPKKKQSCLAKMTEAVSPSKAWGPLDVLAKKARKKYYSKRDEIYHQTKLTKCAHNCLLHENSLEEINHYGTINLEKLQTKIESQKATEETEMILREIQQFTKAKHVEK